MTESSKNYNLAKLRSELGEEVFGALEKSLEKGTKIGAIRAGIFSGLIIGGITYGVFIYTGLNQRDAVVGGVLLGFLQSLLGSLTGGESYKNKIVNREAQNQINSHPELRNYINAYVKTRGSERLWVMSSNHH